MLGKMTAAVALALALALGAVAAAAQGQGSADGRTGSAPKPAADTDDPGKTATDAVTNPAAVPPSEGRADSGKPPAAGGSATPASPPR